MVLRLMAWVSFPKYLVWNHGVGPLTVRSFVFSVYKTKTVNYCILGNDKKYNIVKKPLFEIR